MLNAKAKWEIHAADDELAGRMAEALGIDALLAKLLVARGMTDPEEAELFLQGGLPHFHDPYLLKGMKPAVERIRQAVENGEKIRIYGDYDADGVSSTALMIFLMKRLGAAFDYYIPHRVREGYGLNRGALELAKQQQVSLIVTVDTGISAREEIAYARELGLDVVVTDHHEPPELLPEAIAVINPKQPECPYPFKQLAGVGVAFKLAHALLGELPEDLLEIASIGTVADLMPLLGENRIIVKMGLELMRNTGNPGLQALLDIAGVDIRTVSAGHIGFSVAPRINAGGRLESADEAVRLLTASDKEEAGRLAESLDQLNRERQRIVDEITAQAVEKMEQRIAESGMPKVIVLAQEDWNVGVVGIVASKLLDKYYRPAIVMCIDREKGTAKGSARSIAGFDIYRVLTECHELFTHYGGHQAAAGMSMTVENIDEFDRRLNEAADRILSDDDFIPTVKADLTCTLEEMPVSLIEQLNAFAPFGMGNPSPRLVFNGLKLVEKKLVGRDRQHLRLTLSQQGDKDTCKIEAIGFGIGYLAADISSAAVLDILGEPSVNEWNGSKKPQIVIQDLRVPLVQVYDWRGLRQPMNKLAELLERRTPITGQDAGNRLAVIVDSSQAFNSLRESVKPHIEIEQTAVWRLDGAGQLSPLNEASEKSDIRLAEEIVLFSLPNSLSSLHKLVNIAEQVRRWHALFADADVGESSEFVLPSREMFKKVYSVLQQTGAREIPQHTLVEGLSRRSGFSPALIRFMMEVFEELSFVEKTGSGAYRVVQTPARTDLSLSARLRQRQERVEAERTLIYSSAQELSDWILQCANTKVLEGVQ